MAGDFIFVRLAFVISGFFHICSWLFIAQIGARLSERCSMQPWSRFMEIHPKAERQIWVRWCGIDGIYRWLHPTENRWVEEPDQIGMPMFTDYGSARKAADSCPEPPTWAEFEASLTASADN